MYKASPPDNRIRYRIKYIEVFIAITYERGTTVEILNVAQVVSQYLDSLCLITACTHLAIVGDALLMLSVMKKSSRLFSLTSSGVEESEPWVDWKIKKS